MSRSEGGGGKGGQSRTVDLNAAALDELVKAAKVLSLLALLVQKYKILTAEKRRARMERPQLLSLLALLVQKYKN